VPIRLDEFDVQFGRLSGNKITQWITQFRVLFYQVVYHQKIMDIDHLKQELFGQFGSS